MEPLSVGIARQRTTDEPRFVVCQLCDNRPGHRVDSQSLQALVERKAVFIRCEVSALQVTSKSGRQFIERGLNVVICRFLGFLQCFATEDIFQVEISGYIKKIALFRCHHKGFPLHGRIRRKDASSGTTLLKRTYLC